jgi:phi13 family phage major tail protein
MSARIGAEKFTVAKVLSDTAGGSTTYDTPYEFTKKLMKIGVKVSAKLAMLEADDQVVDTIQGQGNVAIDIDLTDLTEDEKALLLGQTMSSGIRSVNPVTDEAPYFCAMWKSKKANGSYKYYKILKVKFVEPDMDFETKKQTPGFQTDKISGEGIPRLSDGLDRRIADEDATSYVSGTGSGWFSSGDISPDTTPPTVTVSPVDGASGQATSVNIVWTFNEAIQPAFATGAYFTVTKSDGTAVAGTVSINALNTVVTFDPTGSLDSSSTYIAIASSAIKDLSGNSLAANSVTNFATT